MSFFDDVEETRVEPPAEPRRRTPRATRRPPGGGSRPPRGGSRRPVDEQAIRIRRAVAAVALLIILILVIFGVHSCQVSQANSALRDYSNSVASVMRSSINNGQQFFSLLAAGGGSSNAPALHSQLDETRLTAQSQLNTAQGFSVPDQVKTAQQEALLTLQTRLDGITNIAQEIEPALQASTATTALNSIAAEMARFYASDVLYKDYALPQIVGALHSAGIPVGGSNGQPIESGQFFPSLQWLNPSFIAAQLHTTVPTSTAKAAPGVHGHALDSCSVGSTTLDTASTTTLPAGSAPTLTCTVTNDGQNTETNVVVKATISGTSTSGQGIIPQTQSGQQYTVQIPLSSAPPAGTYNLTVTVERVPGETTVTHNTKVFPVTFQ